MITLVRYGERPNVALSEFVGLSTDTKPTVSYNNIGIANGSTFYAMDSKQSFIYDEDNDVWREV